MIGRIGRYLLGFKAEKAAGPARQGFVFFDALEGDCRRSIHEGLPECRFRAVDLNSTTKTFDFPDVKAEIYIREFLNCVPTTAVYQISWIR